MFHSYTRQEMALDLFNSLLNRVIKGEHRYEKFVRPAIEEAHQLASGEKNFYSISRDNFDVIVFLYDSDKEYLEKIDVSNINLETYQHIEKMMSNQLFVMA